MTSPVPSTLSSQHCSGGAIESRCGPSADHLTNNDVVVCNMGVPQGTVLSPFLYTLYTLDFSHNTDSCYLQKFSDDIAIVGRVSEE